jgi:hypothetical protein
VFSHGRDCLASREVSCLTTEAIMSGSIIDIDLDRLVEQIEEVTKENESPSIP